MSSSTHCLRAHCHFISITLRAVAGAVNSTERRSIQLNNQWAGENQQSITVASLNGWVYWLACVCSCCQACGVFWGHKGQRQARGKAYCVKSDTAGLPRMVVGLTVCQGHIFLWPSMAFGKPWVPAVINFLSWASSRADTLCITVTHFSVSQQVGCCFPALLLLLEDWKESAQSISQWWEARPGTLWSLLWWPVSAVNLSASGHSCKGVSWSGYLVWKDSIWWQEGRGKEGSCTFCLLPFPSRCWDQWLSRNPLCLQWLVATVKTHSLVYCVLLCSYLSGLKIDAAVPVSQIYSPSRTHTTLILSLVLFIWRTWVPLPGSKPSRGYPVLLHPPAVTQRNGLNIGISTYCAILGKSSNDVRCQVSPLQSGFN
jgi:hypothetical protein